jgi:aromatic-amino-acid transaminase
MTINMTAEHARRPKVDDPIFDMARRAREATEKLGKDKVINSTLGALADDDGNIVAFKSVYDSLHSMDNGLIAAYAPIAGSKEFQENVIKVCFEEHKPDAHIRAVATPGGTGAVRHGIRTYAGVGDYVICPDRYWKPYESMCQEFDRKFVTYKLFDEGYKFNLEAFEACFVKCLSERDRIVAIFNTPANNPTGYSLSNEEWDKVLDIVKNEAKNPDKRITLLVDIAYIEYAGKGEQKEFFEKFSNLPENVFVLVAYSMSKAYTAYGMRSGAAIGISSSEEIAEEFYYSLNHANRCNRSNGNHGAMNILVDLNENQEKKEAYRKELDHYSQILRKRADAFIKEANKVGLEMIPYFGGFFISLPTEKGKEISEKLEERNIFAISNKNGLRFAICAVSEEKCAKAPAIIKEVMDSLE